MEGDVMDLLINKWKDILETLEIFSCADTVVLSPYFIQFKRFVRFLEVYGKAEYKARNQPNWLSIAKRPTYVKVPKQGANECGFFYVKF
ncbi:hypothetical protein D1007_62193 [Hordeum vulgare]|nr:hypothetical protein D1007_62193 [Hordeum vulgare]